jgi:hypothetical protein
MTSRSLLPEEEPVRGLAPFLCVPEPFAGGTLRHRRGTLRRPALEILRERAESPGG